jgi:hypothetical protein
VLRRVLAVVVSLPVLLALGNARAKAPERLSLDVKHYAHVKLGSLRPTRYDNRGAELILRVDRSASFLLMAFRQPKTVSQVSLRWKSSGKLRVATKGQEETKAGDDYRLRVGLLVAGDPPSLPFFAPGWMRAVRDHLKWPSSDMLYVVVGTHHPAGARWKSPYSNSIEYLAAGATAGADGWNRSSARLPNPLSVVGLWIMADGDNTGSTFRTVLAELALQ